MNRNSRIAAVTLVLAGTQGYAQTYIWNGNSLVENMRQFEESQSPPGTFSSGTYMGYVVGVADAFSGEIWCPGRAGNGVTVSQITSTVAKYMNNNPDKWHLEATTLIMNALQQAFPCKK
ncbi:MAG: Rap1a/Tai family immunity protein [Actinomycetota bacterium]